MKNYTLYFYYIYITYIEKHTCICVCLCVSVLRKREKVLTVHVNMVWGERRCERSVTPLTNW